MSAKTPAKNIEGLDLLVPFDQVTGATQARFLNHLKNLQVEEATEATITDLDLDKLADLIDFTAEKLAKNTAEFEKFTSGKGGFERALNLSIYYANELGKEQA